MRTNLIIFMNKIIKMMVLVLMVLMVEIRLIIKRTILSVIILIKFRTKIIIKIVQSKIRLSEIQAT
jgi:hypothetical protein